MLRKKNYTTANCFSNLINSNLQWGWKEVWTPRGCSHLVFLQTWTTRESWSFLTKRTPKLQSSEALLPCVTGHWEPTDHCSQHEGFVESAVAGVSITGCPQAQPLTVRWVEISVTLSLKLQILQSAGKINREESWQVDPQLNVSMIVGQERKRNTVLTMEAAMNKGLCVGNEVHQKHLIDNSKRKELEKISDWLQTWFHLLIMA